MPSDRDVRLWFDWNPSVWLSRGFDFPRARADHSQALNDPCGVTKNSSFASSRRRIFRREWPENIKRRKATHF